MQIKPIKRLGQNFLVDKNIQRKIIASCALKKADIVLEIGSGRGELTEQIAQNAGFVYALEIDSALCEFLKVKFKDRDNLKIICRDILKFDLEKNFGAKTFKVIGNIPYYISSPILQHLFKFKGSIAKVFISVQKEFAERMVAQPGSKEYGSLSCFIRYHSDCKIIFPIKKGSFFPVPKVDSCFLELTLRKHAPLAKAKERLLFKIIRTAFNQRRKTLKNSLRDILPGINSPKRPEELSLEDFTALLNRENKQKNP